MSTAFKAKVNVGFPLEYFFQHDFEIQIVVGAVAQKVHPLGPTSWSGFDGPLADRIKKCIINIITWISDLITNRYIIVS